MQSTDESKGAEPGDAQTHTHTHANTGDGARKLSITLHLKSFFFLPEKPNPPRGGAKTHLCQIMRPSLLLAFEFPVAARPSTHRTLGLHDKWETPSLDFIAFMRSDPRPLFVVCRLLALPKGKHIVRVFCEKRKLNAYFIHRLAQISLSMAQRQENHHHSSRQCI